MKSTNLQLVICGSFVDVYRYPEGPLLYGITSHKTPIHVPIEVIDEATKKLKEKSRRRSMRRSQRMVHWIVNANAYQYSKTNGSPYPPVMVTHTFKEDIRDVSVATHHFSNGIKRLNYFITNSKKSHLRYLTVIEFQDKTRGGVIHFHTVFFNMPFIPTQKLSQIWGQGIVDARAKRTGQIKDIGSYLSKYMTKDFSDDRLDGKKRYFSSRNLIKPVFVREQELTHSLLHHIPKDTLFRSNEYHSKYQGKIIHETYRLPSSLQLLEMYNQHV